MADHQVSETYSNEDLEEFFENAALSLHWVGPDGTILRANKFELDFLGYDRAEYEGRNIADFHVDRDIIEDILRRLSTGETLNDYEARMRAKDGSIKRVLINSNVRWQDGEFIHTRCFTRDITAAREAEEEMWERAMQLNDDVIQDIAVAKMSLEMRDEKRAMSALENALGATKNIVSHLMEAARRLQPGHFVRRRSS